MIGQLICRVEMYERFIRDLLPGLSLDDTYRLAKEQGVNSAVEMAKGYLPVSQSHLPCFKISDRER